MGADLGVVESAGVLQGTSVKSNGSGNATLSVPGNAFASRAHVDLQTGVGFAKVVDCGFAPVEGATAIPPSLP